jgi:hypothetical protein
MLGETDQGSSSESPFIAMADAREGVKYEEFAASMALGPEQTGMNRVDSEQSRMAPASEVEYRIAAFPTEM